MSGIFTLLKSGHLVYKEFEVFQFCDYFGFVFATLKFLTSDPVAEKLIPVLLRSG